MVPCQRMPFARDLIFTAPFQHLVGVFVIWFSALGFVGAPIESQRCVVQQLPKRLAISVLLEIPEPPEHEKIAAEQILVPQLLDSYRNSRNCFTGLVSNHNRSRAHPVLENP